MGVALVIDGLRWTSATDDRARQRHEVEDIPVGSIVRTPTGALAEVTGYRGLTFRRDHRARLVCRYCDPTNKRFGVVQLVPELVTVVRRGGG